MTLDEKYRITPIQLKLIIISIFVFSITLHALPFLKYGNLYGYDDQAHFAVVEDTLDTGHISPTDTLITPSYVEFPILFAFESMISSVLGVDPSISGLIIVELATILLLIFTIIFLRDFIGDNKIMMILSVFFITVAPNLLFRMTFRVPQTVGFVLFLIVMMLFFRVLSNPAGKYICLFLIFSISILLTHPLTSLILIASLWVALQSWEFIHLKRNYIAFILVFLIICLTFYMFLSSDYILTLLSTNIKNLNIFISPEIIAGLIIIFIILFYFSSHNLAAKLITLMSYFKKYIYLVFNLFERKGYFISACILPAMLVLWYVFYFTLIDDKFISRWFIDKLYLYIWLFLSLLGFRIAWNKNRDAAVVFSSGVVILILVLIGWFFLATVLLPLRVFLFYFVLTTPFVALGCYELFFRFRDKNQAMIRKNFLSSLITRKNLLSTFVTILIILSIFYAPLFVIYNYEPTETSRPYFYYDDELSAVMWLKSINLNNETIIASDGRGGYLSLRGDLNPTWATFRRHQRLISSGEVKNGTIYFMTSSMIQSTNVQGSPFSDPKKASLSTIDIDAIYLDLIYTSSHVRAYNAIDDGKIDPLIESGY
jgi:hypothetical protein